MAFLADELDPLADDLDMHLDPGRGLGSSIASGSGFGGSGFGGNGFGMGMSLADELDGPGPEDLGAIGGMGSLALELEQTLPDPLPLPLSTRDNQNRVSPAKISPAKTTKANGGSGNPSPVPAPSSRGGARRRSPSSLNGTPPRRRANQNQTQTVRAPSLSLALSNSNLQAERSDTSTSPSNPNTNTNLNPNTNHAGPGPARALNTSSTTSSSLSTSPADPYGEEGVARAEAEATAALKTMQDALASSSALVGMLKGLDRPIAARINPASASRAPAAKSLIPVPASSNSPSSPAPTSATTASSIASAPQHVLLEDRLQAHLARLGEAERLREEQAREAAHLARELANVRWEGLEVDLEGLNSVLAPSGSPPTPGWTGETTDKVRDKDKAPPASTSRGPRMNGFHLETIGESPSSPAPLSPVDPISPISPMSPHYPASPTTPMTPTTAMRSHPLSQAAAGLVDDTAALSATLSSLSESVSLSLARHAADGRTLRRARLGLRDWHEREATEDACQRGVDAWEDRVARGEVPDARAEMGRMLQGFRDALEAAEREVYALTPVREMEIGMAL